MAKNKAKVPPHSNEAEESVLGSILIDKDAISVIAPILKPEHFYNENNGRIYEAALKLYENRRPIDLVTLTSELKKTKDFSQIGGASYLADLTNRVATAVNVEEYAQIIKRNWIKRQLISASSRISTLAFNEAKESSEVLEEAEKKIFSISQSGITRSFIPVKDALIESFDRLDELHKKSSGLRGLPTGFPQLDNLLAGMQNSNLIVLAARPGIGKTALSLNIARHIAVEEKIPTGFFSLEMSQEELVDRLLVRQAQIDSWKLKTGRLDEDDFSRLSDAMGTLAEAPLYIDDTPGISILEMRTKARRLQMEKGLKLLIVDYLQLIHGRGNIENRVQEVSEISQGLKNLARELKIPVLSLSQLSRAVEVRGGQRPRLADLRESGCLRGNTQLIEAQTGRLVTIEQLTKKQKPTTLLTMNSRLRLIEGKATKFFPSGTKKIFRLTLNSGREIEASANHPFYTVNGWKRLDQLTEKDYLGTARKIPFPQQPLEIDSNRLIVLAHLVGDGCYIKGQPLHYTNKDPKNLAAVTEAAQKGFEIKARPVKQEGWYHLYLSHGVGKPNPLIIWLKKLAIFNQRSDQKILPEIIFRLKEADLALFIRHLWATDGCFVASGDYWSLYYSSTSHPLIKQIQHLLLRFGIQSRIKQSQKGNYSPSYILTISGKTEQLKFLKKIGVFGKEKEGKEAITSLKKLKANPNLDVVPKIVWQIIENARKEQKLTTREFHRQLGWAYSGTQRHKHGVSRMRLKKINQVLENDQLANLANSDLYWDQIVKIEPLGEETVYDATIKDTHNFLAEDIIVHNSIEQDSDVVMFLYREDDENRENIILEIAKHRNGPIGLINLRFLQKQISFYPLEKKL